jgi:hypothetical protein
MTAPKNSILKPFLATKKETNQKPDNSFNGQLYALLGETALEPPFRHSSPSPTELSIFDSPDPPTTSRDRVLVDTQVKPLLYILTSKGEFVQHDRVKIRVQCSTLSSGWPVFDLEAQTRRELTAEGRPKGVSGFGSPQTSEVYRTKTCGGHACLRKAISQKKFNRTSQRPNIWGLR